MKTHTHTQHTPGPWSDSGHDGKRNVIVESKLGSIAAVWDTGDTMQMKANARVIAAAPELLAALEAILEPIDAPGGTIRSITWQSIAQARAALEKAKGTP